MFHIYVNLLYRRFVLLLLEVSVSLKSSFGDTTLTLCQGAPFYFLNGECRECLDSHSPIEIAANTHHSKHGYLNRVKVLTSLSYQVPAAPRDMPQGYQRSAIEAPTSCSTWGALGAGGCGLATVQHAGEEAMGPVVSR